MSDLSGFTPDRPLVLVTDYPPDTAGGGAVILRSLLGPEDRARIVWVTLAAPADPASAGRDGPVVVRPGVPASPRRSQFLDCTRRAGPLAEGVLNVARRRGARALWVLMHGAGVALGARLTRAGALPTHLTVHDDPAFGVALRSRRYVALLPWIERDFAAAMRRATSVDVIGEGMADRYRRRYGVDPVIVHRGLREAVAASPPYDRAAGGLRVGVLGNTYAYGQLVTLGHAIARAAGRLGVPGRLLVVGRSFGERLRTDLAGRAEVEVEVTGHVDEAEGIARLRRCFLLYLNYPFSPLHRVLRRTSFPTKLSTYALAARPILVHAPGDSSVAGLDGSGGYVLPWRDDRVEAGAGLLSRAWADPAADRSFHAEAERLRGRYYDYPTNRRTLLAALNALAAPAAAGHAAPGPSLQGVIDG